MLVVRVQPAPELPVALQLDKHGFVQRKTDEIERFFDRLVISGLLRSLILLICHGAASSSRTRAERLEFCSRMQSGRAFYAAPR